MPAYYCQTDTDDIFGIFFRKRGADKAASAAQRHFQAAFHDISHYDITIITPPPGNIDDIISFDSW